MIRKSNKRIVTDWEEVPLIMTIADVSMIMQLCNESVRQLLANGTIPGIKDGKSWRIYKNDFKEFIEGKQNGT